jgi:hypothetical protein
MKFLSLSLVLGLTACTAGLKDTADTAGGDVGAVPNIEFVGAGCDDTTGKCNWLVETSGTMGNVEIQMIETGSSGDYELDPGCTEAIGVDGQTSSGEARPGGGGITCGVWSEYHDLFELATTSNEYGGESKSINLDLVTDFRDQVNNESTLFGDLTRARAKFESTTVLVTVYDAAGDFADCRADGHMPSYFASQCDDAR